MWICYLATKANRISLICLVKSVFVRFFIFEINCDSGLVEIEETTSFPHKTSVPLKSTEKYGISPFQDSSYEIS